MPLLDSSAFVGSDALPASLRCDVCIIGTGPAGMVIARELSGTPLRVTVLESGGAERQEETDALNKIESVGYPRVMDQWLVRNRIVGGSSSTWSGRCAPFDEIDMQFRGWVPYSGWPFSIDDLIPYLDRSAKYLGLGTGSAFTDDRVWAQIGRQRPEFNPDPDKLLPMFWQYSRDSISRYDQVRFGRHLTADLGPNVTLVTNATVLRINLTESGAAVESLEFAAIGGRRWSLQASTIVVCAGGIENARLLLCSDNVMAQGLGNSKDLVGRFLMDHPRGTVASFRTEQAKKAALSRFGVFKSRAAGAHLYQHGMRLSPAIQRSEQLLNCAAWIGEHSAPDDPWDALTRLLRGQADVRQDLLAMLTNTGLVVRGLKEYFISHNGLPRKVEALTLDAMCEQRPNPHSRLTLSDRRDHLGMRIPRIDWRVSEEEARAMRRIAELTVEQFPRIGLESLVLEDWVRDGAMFPQTIRDAAHPTGTTRMADDPAHGVVDAQCQVHGVAGLFIAGSSVFPTSGQANPTQMIAALALRLADTLKGRGAAVTEMRRNPMASVKDSAHPQVETARCNAPTRVLVTGATGTIGRHVVSELLARGYYVRALTSKPVAEAPVSDRLEWCQLDFQQSLDFDPLVRGCAAVLHLGAELYVVERMQRSNVEATQALAEASERAGLKVFCYTSSVSVYGSSRRRRVPEDSPVLTTGRDVRSEYMGSKELRCYGRTKLQGEFAIGAVAHDVEYVILRPAVVVDVQGLVELGDWSKGKKQRAGSRHAHHVYVHDVADAMLWFMERGLQRDQPSPGVSVFNLAEDDTPVKTYDQIFKAAYEASGDRRWLAAPMPWPLEWPLAIFKFRTLPLRAPFGRMLFPDDKLRKAGYAPRFGMSHAIALFREELASASAGAAEDIGSMESAYDVPAGTQVSDNGSSAGP